MPAKKADKKPKLVGRVKHYFGNIKVAVVRFSAPVKKGDTLRIEGGENSFTQKVASLEKDHIKVSSAKKGEVLGMRVSRKVREGYRVFK